MTEPKTIVAIGASAGGLGPCELFFDHAPVDKGFAYVVIQHLSPDFRSLMDELLARHSSMPIHRVENGMVIEPNTIYLNRPRQVLTVADGKFVVAPEETEDVIRLPIDDFFNSIADEYGDEAVAVILSGSGSDGVRGARQIKSRGGRVFAQTPETAKFDSMPRAIQTAKLEDGSAAPEDLPELIQRHIAGEFGLGGNFYREMTSDPVFDILGLMQDRFGTNFTYYKIETVARRLNRRKDLSGHADVRDYYRTLLQDPDELETLYNDLLIEVTAFFRDKPAFDLLARDAIPEICRDMSPQRQVRMWVPGCASGEEAYTLAIQVAEFARANDKAFNLKILATDIHKRSLSAASAGIFSNETLAAVDENLIERYFEKTGDYHQVRQNLRRAVVFSPHDLLRDPPFTRMDLVSCRNVMIYLTEEAQQKLLALFHFSLNKDGYLFLGPSETTGKLHREFTQISQRWRIFRKTRDVRLMESTRLLNSQRPPMDASLALATTRKPATKAAPMRVANDPKSTAISAALHRLLGIYGPPGFLIDQSGQLTHIFGDARKHLRFNTGGFSNVLTELLREDLKPFVAPMIDRFKHGIMVEHARSATLTEEDGETIELRLLMRPLIEEDTDGGPYAIVTLEQTGRVETDIALIPSSDDADDIDRDLVTSYASRVSELEQMLGSTEESLQATIEEMETSNEELQATNEELMSANEELQSTNEELHSVNEELYTVSSEHERKIEELSELTSDMDHLLKSTAIGTIFLDSDLQVRRFTPAAAHTFNLIAQDVGRPFAHVTARFSTVDVQDIVRQVQADAKPVDSEIVSNDRSYLMRVLPYVSDVQQKPGVVITMIDIDALSRARTRIADMEQLHDEVLKDIGQLIVRWNKADGEVTFCNATFAELCGGSIADLLGTDFKTHLSAEVHAKINDATKEIAPGAFRRVMFKYTDPSGADRYFDNMLRALSDKSGNIFGFQITGRDMTPDQEYIRTLEEVLEVDRSDYPASKYGSHVAKNELARVEKLFEIVQSYLGATQLLVTIGGHDETPKPLELPAVSQPGVVPQSAYNSLEKIVSDDAASSETVGIRKVNLAGRNQHKTLLNDLGASRAIVGPIISRNAVIGRVALAVSSHHPDRDFTELELALARITIRWAGYIWDRSRTIEAIESTSAQLMLTIDHLPARVWFKDDQNKIIWLNSTAAASMGMSVENATGINTYDQFPEMAGKYHKDDLAVINSGRPKLGIIEKFTPKHGPHGWSKTDKIPYVDPRTGARNLLVISTDITMLKNQEAEIERLNKSLNQQRGLYREIYQHTPAMMLTTDAENRIEDANDLLAKTGGYTREELIGRAMRDVFLERKRDTDLPQVDERDSGEPMRLLCSNGTLLDVELAGIDDTLADGEFRRLWVVHDVSARNLALAALEAKNSELEHLNDGLAQFAYAASHDLQEPLRKIRQYGDLLTEDYSDNLDKDGQFYVDVMTSSAERMSSLVKNLLQFSSASQGDFTPQEIPLGKLVDKVVDDYKQVIEETGATITSDTLPSVRCDENLVQIVFSNIISNALKYRAPQRAPEIKVGVEQSDDRIILSFTDNGIGFDKSEAERIFDPFVRLVSKSEAQGTGIGLAICRTICERHNWTLTASSTKGSHTRIEIRIPIESSEWAK
ncbi:CheR family methyltransferase [uncultured Tateyamaria sp.]|uniref:CheR family methyltransferase n=1 Tax=uncultured Tateyamaria sp. TaxID=455651 RepID=UPI00261F12B2|nr:CheR family methyltransferase [uncultured Tateyamaria sp.]